MTPPTPQPTEDSYRELTLAYDFFNRELFDGCLPGALITVTRKKYTAGYYSHARFAIRNNARSPSTCDEIALNPTLFGTRPIEYVLSTLVHEQCHQWQRHFAKAPRAGYHDRVWGGKMEAIGLMPSHTGEVGGRKTGDVMSDYVIEGGKFAEKCVDLLTQEFRLSWYDRFTRDRVQPPRADSPVRKLLAARLGAAETTTEAPRPTPPATPGIGLAVTLGDVEMALGPELQCVDSDDAPTAPSPPVRPLGTDEPVAPFNIQLDTILGPVRMGFDEPIDTPAPPSDLVPNSLRVKYTCACKHNVWGKPRLKLMCMDCGSAFAPNRASRRNQTSEND